MSRTIYRGKIFTFRSNANLQNIRNATPNALFVDSNEFLFLRDGAIVVVDGKITAVDDFHILQKSLLPNDVVVDYSNKLITPGFIDTHMHSTQTSAVGSYGEKLLEWLDNYIFPSEEVFNSDSSARLEFGILLNQLFRNGTTTICSYLPCAYDGADVIFDIANQFNMRAILGNTIMTDGSPRLVTDPATSMKISERLYEKWHNNNRMHYALTPRFALSCTEETLGLCKEFVQSHKDVYIQTHINENLSEIKDTLTKFPWAKDYLDVYEKYDLVNNRSIYAHCIHNTESEWQRMKEKGAIFSNCPTSNNYLGSGFFNYEKALTMDVKLTMGSDWGAGNTLSMLRVMDDAYKVAMLSSFKLETLVRWYTCTLGSAKALELDHCIGSLEVGKEADFIVIEPNNNELLSRRLENCYNLLDYLFALTALGDDRLIHATYIYGKKVHGHE